MTGEPVTAVEGWRGERQWRLNLFLVVLALLIALGLGVLFIGGYLAIRMARSDTPTYASIMDHFKYGSIGAEHRNSGIPYALWKTLPFLYPEEFGGRDDYAAFGFLYETDESGRRRDLPIGISRREVNGVEVVWLNCSTCHTGTWREAEGENPHIVPAMPSNNLDFHRFVKLLLRAAVDERLAPDRLFPAMEAAGVKLGLVDRLIWRIGVLPRLREGLLNTRAAMLPLLEIQPNWGPGRVDTFNPYKLIQFGITAHALGANERVGVADLPAVFNQGPRDGMHLHWDGNNVNLQERNLSAAIGAGVTPNTVDHDAISRVADWLKALKPPPSPYRPTVEAVARGATVYQRTCASCHGRNGESGYVFEGAKLGLVTPISELGTDPARLNSYTEAFRQKQLERLFVGTPYRFRHFEKTDGYANLPLDGLWLRSPYLHNGSVPTIADLLKQPNERPRTFLRGSDVIDPINGGFQSPPCDPSKRSATGFCFDTSLPGNGAGGHLYGTDLPADEKADLLAYLLTF
jgi:mono/diheme cytochrome c family protein